MATLSEKIRAQTVKHAVRDAYREAAADVEFSGEDLRAAAWHGVVDADADCLPRYMRDEVERRVYAKLCRAYPEFVD